MHNNYANRRALGNLFTGLCCLVLLFSACEKDKELNTNPFNSSEISVQAYGPNPALRGQKVTFVGTRMDQITKVIFSEGVETTEIEVLSNQKIQVVLPQDAVYGPVRLVIGDGREFSFETPLEISEPVEITSMSPQPVKAGQSLTLEGDYFNLIQRVIFADNVEVSSEDFETHERTKIVLEVPAEAQTGYLLLADTAEIPLEYESSEKLEIVLPSVEEVLSLSAQRPGDEISIKGKDLDLIRTIAAPNGSEIPFEVDEDEVSFTLPEDISDGAVVMIPASGVEVEIVTVEVAAPEDLEVVPSERLRPGDEIRITGKNLDLVRTVRFTGVEEETEPSGISADELTVIFPDEAVSGEMALLVGSGKNAVLEIVTQKPEVSSFAGLTVQAGTDWNLTGENLDLVTRVIFPEDLEVAVEAAQPGELTIRVPLNAQPGPLVLMMANGESVETENLEISAPEFCFIPDPPSSKAEIPAGGVLTVQVENGEALKEVLINGQPVNFIVDAPNLYIVIPGNASGETELSLVSSNGEAIYRIPVKGKGIVETVIYDGELFELNWSEGLRLNKELFENVPAGSKLKIYMAESPEGASIAYSDANWVKLTIDDPNFDPQWETVSIPVGSTDYTIDLTGEILNTILTVDDGWSETGLMLTGEGVIVSSISIISGEAPQETVLFEGAYEMNWSEGIRLYKEDLENVRPGTVLKLYFSADGDASFAVQDANWGKVELEGDPNYSAEWGSVSVPDGVDSYEIVLSREILEKVLSEEDGWSTTAFILTGEGMTMEKITLME